MMPWTERKRCAWAGDLNRRIWRFPLTCRLVGDFGSVASCACRRHAIIDGRAPSPSAVSMIVRVVLGLHRRSSVPRKYQPSMSWSRATPIGTCRWQRWRDTRSASAKSSPLPRRGASWFASASIRLTHVLVGSLQLSPFSAPFCASPGSPWRTRAYPQELQR